MSNLIDLLDYGQSYWLDNLSREKITSGELKKRVSEQGLRGITSNPSIFHKSITGSDGYDDQIRTLTAKGLTPQQIYDELTVQDVQQACDILRPVYDAANGTDGFVSLEVSPYLARDTQGSIAAARRLNKMVNRPNCMIKIPGTKEGLPAIEQLLVEGININVTLLFSVARYVEVGEAYIRALTRRLAEGKPLDKTISVASFFLSRIDVLTDQLLSQHIVTATEVGNKEPQFLFGKAGIASAKLAYQRFKGLFASPEWEVLARKGAQVQRPLWASTGNKDPLLSDVRYVNALIGKDTVNTLPDDTIDAFAAHGELRHNAVESDVAGAQELFDDLRSMSIDIDAIAWELEHEGIRKFTQPYDELTGALAEKSKAMSGLKFPVSQMSYGALKKEIEAAFSSVDEKQTGQRLFRKDASLWKSDDAERRMITENMGWVTLPDNSGDVTEKLINFSAEVKAEGFRYAVLLGMGGSSLCSEVARSTFDRAEGFPELIVLDDTDPAAIEAVKNKVEINKTLIIVATKSGGTMETLSFFRYFYKELEESGNKEPGKNFVAITDAESPLVQIAAEYRFREVFINPPGIGGRYSVLSDFGLLPMALMGIDIRSLMNSAHQMKVSCSPEVPCAYNPGLSLGIVLGICQRHGRDKVTFVLSQSIGSFGYWVEQLLAESTGKEGKGLIPVNGEPLGAAGQYGADRVFVHMYVAADDKASDDQRLKALEEAGHPVIRICVPDKTALGGEYYRWEIAVAAAGIILAINPFDQPNVEESKKNTSKLLADWKQEKKFAVTEPALRDGDIYVYTGAKANFAMTGIATAGQMINHFIALAKQHDYVAFLPYFLMNNERNAILQSWRVEVRDKKKIATTLLNGPRYLHSTGQLHKGGPDSGLYILLVCQSKMDMPIPGEQFGFGTLHEAQWLGDFKSLNDKGRRVIRIDLGDDADKGLAALLRSLKDKNDELHA